MFWSDLSLTTFAHTQNALRESKNRKNRKESKEYQVSYKRENSREDLLTKLKNLFLGLHLYKYVFWLFRMIRKMMALFL